MYNKKSDINETEQPFGKFASLIILVLFSFSVIYNISFIGNKLFTTGRFAVFLLTCLVLFRGINLSRFFSNKTVWLLFLPFPYVAFQFLLVREPTQLGRYINLFVLSYLGAFLVSHFVKNTKLLCFSILIAVSLQAIIIIYSLFSMDYRMWLSTVVEQYSNFDFEDGFRAPGFTNGSGASLSVKQSLGVFAGVFLLNEFKKDKAISMLKHIFVQFLMFICLLSCIVSGRTGLLLSILFMIFTMFLNRYSIKFTLIGLVSIFALLLLSGEIIKTYLPEKFSYDFILSWAFSVFTGEDNTIKTLSDMPVPQLSVETILGTGKLQEGGIDAIGHDSGFIKTYYCMGLFWSLIFYLSYLFVLLKTTNWLKGTIHIIVALTFFILEVKEPFVFKYAHMYVLLSIFYCYQMDLEKKIEYDNLHNHE